MPSRCKQWSFRYCAYEIDENRGDQVNRNTVSSAEIDYSRSQTSHARKPVGRLPVLALYVPVRVDVCKVKIIISSGMKVASLPQSTPVQYMWAHITPPPAPKL